MGSYMLFKNLHLKRNSHRSTKNQKPVSELNRIDSAICHFRRQLVFKAMYFYKVVLFEFLANQGECHPVEDLNETDFVITCSHSCISGIETNTNRSKSSLVVFD